MRLNIDPWLQTLIPLGGFGLLLFLLLQNKLIHPTTLANLLAEKDRQIAKADADAAEWKAAYQASEQARAACETARNMAERRADAAVETAQLVADGLDKLRSRLEPQRGEEATDVRPQRRGPRSTAAG